MRGGFDPRTFYTQISLNAIRGTVPWMKSGYNDAVGTTEEDMWALGGVYVWIPVAQQLEVVSSSANDSAAGSGVQQVQVSYLDGSYNEGSEIVTMNGLGAVNTASSSIFRIQSFRAYRCGATIPNAAAGNIDIRTVGGAGNTYSRIPQGYTRARNQCWTVPTGKVLYVTSINFSTGSAAGARSVRFTSRATYDNATARVLGPNFFMAYTEIQLQDSAIYVELEEPTRFPATTDIKVTALSDANSAMCATICRGFVQTLGQV